MLSNMADLVSRLNTGQSEPRDADTGLILCVDLSWASLGVHCDSCLAVYGLKVRPSRNQPGWDPDLPLI